MEVRMRFTGFLALTLAALLASTSASSATTLRCEMDFTLSSRAVFYKKAEGEGIVQCSNGESMRVNLRSEGGGFTFGKSTIDDGHGEFTGVTTINEVLGNYATGGAHAGAGESQAAIGLTKGEVSPSLKGKGRGVNFGVD